MQLVAYGAQDVYLSGNPQITYFKTMYRRHTNFAIQSIEQTFNGNPDFGNRVTCPITRNGDLVHRVYLQVTLSNGGADAATLVNHVGHFLINYVELEIGGQRIDKHYGEWLDVWNELTQAAEKKEGYDVMVGDNTDNTNTLASGAERTFYVPLIFWFNRNAGLALPLIALQYHEVRFNVQFRTRAQLVAGAGAADVTMSKCSLWVDYIFLDTDERRRFAQSSHEYLIEQLQFTGAETISGGTGQSVKSKLNFNHPVKFLAWFVRYFDDANSAIEWNNYTNDTGTAAGVGAGANPVRDAKLQLNGHDRFDTRAGDYFNLVQPYQHFPRIPVTGVNVYSFALNPVEHQPSASCNFSRIDNATLQLTVDGEAGGDAGQLWVFAFNYNILRVTSGMGGVAYAN